MTPTFLKATAQILILAVGIYLLLAFLRSTRGSGLVRGLGVTLIVGVYGLWGISDRLGLEELRHVISSLLGLVFVILAIIFQPELRRGLASLSDHPLLSRLLGTQRKESMGEVAAAIVTMAKKKQGALIVFERRTPLDPYIESAVRLDCAVNRYLIDSLFHSGNALHDGAIVVRGQRVIAAAVILPLSGREDIAKSTGTRHRAALGITEETDAVAAVVSEETGTISLAKHGEMVPRIPRDELEEILRGVLGADALPSRGGGEAEERAESAEPRRNWLAVLADHAGQKLGALVLATLVFYGAHQDLMGNDSIPLTIEAATVARAGTPKPGALLVYLPSNRYRLGPDTPSRCQVTFVGTHQELASLQGISGSVTIAESELADLQGQKRLVLDIGRVEWGLPLRERMDIFWSGKPPELTIEGLAECAVNLQSSLVQIDDSQLPSTFEALRDALEFRPQKVVVRGPRPAVELFEERLRRHLAAVSGAPDGDEVPEPLFVTQDPLVPGEGEVVWTRAQLAPDLAALGLTLSEQPNVKVQVVLEEVEIGLLELPISLQSLAGTGDPRRFLPPSGQAAVRLWARGIPPVRRDSEDWTIETLRVRELLRTHLRAFIDVDRMEPGSNRGRVELHGSEDWRHILLELGEPYRAALADPRTSLRIDLGSEREVFLEPRVDEREDPAPGGGDE